MQTMRRLKIRFKIRQESRTKFNFVIFRLLKFVELYYV